jgi:hypothetical protein
MLRKTMLTLAAAVALGAAALAPNTASAHWGGGGHGGWRGGWHGPYFRVYAGPAYGGCLVRRWIYTPYGPALRWVNVCF